MSIRTIKNFSYVEGDRKIYLMEVQVGLEMYRQTEAFYVADFAAKDSRNRVAYRLRSARHRMARVLAQYNEFKKAGEGINAYILRADRADEANARLARGMKSSYKHNRRNM